MIPGWSAVDHIPVLYEIPMPVHEEVFGNGETFIEAEVGEQDSSIIQLGNFGIEYSVGFSEFGDFGYTVTLQRHTPFGVYLIDRLYIERALRLISESCPDTTVVTSEETGTPATANGYD